MGRVLLGYLLLHRPSQHPSHFVAKILNLGEGRLLRRAIRSETTRRHRSNAFIQLLLCLDCQSNRNSSVLAHASFLPKRASFTKPRPNIPSQGK